MGADDFGYRFWRTRLFCSLPVNDLPAVDYPVIQGMSAIPAQRRKRWRTTKHPVCCLCRLRLQVVTSTATGAPASSVLGSSKSVMQRTSKRPSRVCDGAAPGGPALSPTFPKTNPNDQPIMYVGITSDSATQGQLFDYANTQVGERIRIPSGVSQVAVYGAQSAVRIKADPSRWPRATELMT